MSKQCGTLSDELIITLVLATAVGKVSHSQGESGPGPGLHSAQALGIRAIATPFTAFHGLNAEPSVERLGYRLRALSGTSHDLLDRISGFGA